MSTGDAGGSENDERIAEAEPAANNEELAVLRSLLEGTSHQTGEEFFQSLVRNLAAAVGTKYAFVAEFAKVNTRAHAGILEKRSHRERTLSLTSREHPAKR